MFIPQETIKEELELRNLPSLDLLRFDGSPVFIIEFIKNCGLMLFSLRMNHFMNSLAGKAKKLVKTVDANSDFYATALQVLKRDLGNP